MFLPFIVLFIILATAVGILLIRAGWLNKDGYQVLFGGLCVFIVICTIISVAVLQSNQEVESKINAGYAVYIDGVEVDADKIDVKNYLYRINEAEREIYMTGR